MLQPKQNVRAFQSRAEYIQWTDRIKASAMPRPKNAIVMSPTVAAPVLTSVDPRAEKHYTAWAVPRDAILKKFTPSASFLEVQASLSSDLTMRRALSDIGSWSAIRLSKFYEAVDALTGDVAMRFAAEMEKEISWVTAGHYHSRKLKRTDIAEDMTVRSYITNVGRTSMEIRSDALQNNKLINVCHTIMVAKDVAALYGPDFALPQLELDEEDRNGQMERASLAQLHNVIRKQRAQDTVELRTPISSPPSNDEIQFLHNMHRRAIRMKEGPKPRPPRPRTVGEYTFRSSFVIFPEDRNLQGKLFGGYVMSQSYNLALYAVKFFARSSNTSRSGTVVPLGVDEAVFHQPIAIGDLVTFTARVVHATEYTCRVLVTVQVRDPMDAERLPQRSNRLMFVFAAETPPDCKKEKGGCSFILPNTYSEMLMQLEASRRYVVEGPTEEEALSILLASRL